jgi:two-component system, NarL family, sensor histidine kinase DevS
VNMEQRAFELDGSCSIKSVPEQGTTLVWSVPAR